MPGKPSSGSSSHKLHPFLVHLVHHWEAEEVHQDRRALWLLSKCQKSKWVCRKLAVDWEREARDALCRHTLRRESWWRQFIQHIQRAMLDTCDLSLSRVCSQWWGDETWPTKRLWQRPRQWQQQRQWQRQSYRLVTYESLITILTIESLDSWQSLSLVSSWLNIFTANWKKTTLTSCSTTTCTSTSLKSWSGSGTENHNWIDFDLFKAENIHLQAWSWFPTAGPQAWVTLQSTGISRSDLSTTTSHLISWVKPCSPSVPSLPIPQSTLRSGQSLSSTSAHCTGWQSDSYFLEKLAHLQILSEPHLNKPSSWAGVTFNSHQTNSLSKHNAYFTVRWTHVILKTEST